MLVSKISFDLLDISEFRFKQLSRQHLLTDAALHINFIITIIYVSSKKLKVSYLLIGTVLDY